MSRVAQLLYEALQRAEESLGGSSVYLPDSEGRIQRADLLALDDTKWLESSSALKFVSGKIPPEVARLLGVRGKRTQDLMRLCKMLPWAQKEELAVRIKRLLEGYTCDSSILKELIQNADDAGATEIRFIKDFRKLGTEKVLEGCEKLQGPALSVYNNAFFTEEDLVGIIKLGEGSKAEDPLKTGQYGVGFNAVYHLTDVPSFWTWESDDRQAIIAFDPNVQYLLLDNKCFPGIRINDVGWIRSCYTDTFQGYLENNLNMTKPGTVFRFPLRTEPSGIKDEPMTESDLVEILDSFKVGMSSCLLFLRNIRRIGVYTIDTRGELVRECEVKKEMDQSSSTEMTRFQDHLRNAMNRIREGAHPQDISEYQSVLSMTVSDSSNNTENWLVVKRLGFDASTCTNRIQTEGHGKHSVLLPHGGVAVRVSERSAQGKNSVPKSETGIAFCMLPLPLETGLPVHVNGHFALDHETRRSLWDNKEDARTEWNKALALQVVVPAYITAIERVRDLWFSKKRKSDASTSVFLAHYHTLFPSLDKATTSFWKLLMEELYRQIGRRELPLFPVVNDACSITAWVPVVKSDGFPGYFSDAVCFFRSGTHHTERDEEKLSASKKVALTKKDRLHKLLKELNMSVIDTPYHIMKNFLESGEDRVREISPASVITFLKSACRQQTGGCNIGSLPQQVSSTPFREAPNVELLLKFLTKAQCFSDQVEGLPLCLRQSGNLHFFHTAEDIIPIASEFYHLLPGSSDVFLHERIFKYFVPVEEKTRSMIRVLDIPLLSQMLPKTISESEYKTRKPYLLLPENLPSEIWLKNIWKFLQKEIKVSKVGEEDDRSVDERLNCLRDWSLIPVTKWTGATQQVFLFPLKDAHHVVHLSSKRDVANPLLWETLRTLPLPFLETSQLPPLCIAEDIVASISRPAALLQALISCGERLTSSKEHAYSVLAYFDTSLKTLLEVYTDGSELREMLKSLPFYIDISGSIGPIPKRSPALCITSDVPADGLISWCQDRLERVVLLRQTDVPKRLHDFIGFTDTPDVQFYQLYLLPTIAALPRSAILTHMSYLRQRFDSAYLEDMDGLCEELKHTAFVEFCDRLFKAEEFYTPFEPVFREMCRPPEMFPPEPYCNVEWSTFMRKAGIIWEVTEHKFVWYAKRLENESQDRVTEMVSKKSGVLVHHLFHRKDLTKGSLLEQVRSIRFLLPSEWTETDDGRRLAKIAAPFTHDRLVSFEESCSEQHLHLVWTSSYILHHTADPLYVFRQYSDSRSVFSTDIQHRNTDVLETILHKLTWQEHAPIKTVIKHVQNLCSSLDVEEPSHSCVWEETEMLYKVMNIVYTYLHKHISYVSIGQVAKLPLICDLGNKRMLCAENVVIEISLEEAITGYLHPLPRCFGAYDELFRKLGVKQRVTADHYARVLSQLKSRWGDQELHVEAMKIVTQAVKGLFECLGSSIEEKKQLTLRHLYLPSESCELLESTKLMYNNKEHLGDRCRELSDTNLHFFLGFSRMKIICARPRDKIDLLPELFRMPCLSDIVKEMLPETIAMTATYGECSKTLDRKLVHQDCVACVVRLAYHQHKRETTAQRKTFNQETERHIAKVMSRINIREVMGLKTVLTLRDEVMPNSEEPKQLFVRRVGARYTLYLDTNSCTSLHDTSRGLASAVLLALHLNPSSFLLLQRIFEDPKAAMQAMDDSEIELYSVMTVDEGSVFPSPGTHIPTRLHCYLDNRLDHVFSPGEHVGFGVDDPQVNEDNTDDNEATYIYAVVIRLVDSEDQDTPAWARHYIIDVGIDNGGEIDVSATVLFKLCDPPRPNAEQEVEEPATEEATPLNMDSVLREIRQTLTIAWGQPVTAERRLVVKRLYLRWHPDKNPRENAPFYTEVTQTIQRYVTMLEQGRILDDVDTGDVVDGCDFASSYTSFFSNMDTRSRRHRDCYEANARDWGAQSERIYRGGTSWYSESTRNVNPQPGDARRWMRQAEADLAAAQAAKGSCDRGHWWVCYMCHQAVEKALKAIILLKDANQASQSHDLPSLACQTQDSTLSALATQLERHVGRHTRMRYPDAHDGGRIPADVYSIDHACHACTLADQLLQQARNFFQR